MPFDAQPSAGRQTFRLPRMLLLILVLLVIVLLAISCASLPQDGVPWYQARRDSSGQAPDPATTPEPVIQVYAARAAGWRGAFGVHTWIAVKPSHAARFTRYEVIGWGVSEHTQAVRRDRMGPDNYWFGNRPELILDRRGGAEVETMIGRIEDAVASYPYPHFYRIWPGPNSNTFMAHIARAVPELGLALPANALGKDYLPNGSFFAAAPSGSGFQVSLLGALGLLLAVEEGVEVNLLGFTWGIDPKGVALKLPGIGRLGWPSSPEAALAQPGAPERKDAAAG
jgi:hypothetical protein